MVERTFQEFDNFLNLCGRPAAANYVMMYFGKLYFKVFMAVNIGIEMQMMVAWLAAAVAIWTAVALLAALRVDHLDLKECDSELRNFKWGMNESEVFTAVGVHGSRTPLLLQVEIETKAALAVTYSDAMEFRIVVWPASEIP